MKELLQNLIEALREELKQYGEMLALLDQQQRWVVQHHAPDLLASVSAVEAQAGVIRAARAEREQRRLHVVRTLGLNEGAGFRELLPGLPPEFQPLVSALVQENNDLLRRVQQRARQNHLLLTRAVELMQRCLNTLVPASAGMTYTASGRLPEEPLSQPALYDAIG